MWPGHVGPLLGVLPCTAQVRRKSWVGRVGRPQGEALESMSFRSLCRGREHKLLVEGFWAAAFGYSCSLTVIKGPESPQSFCEDLPLLLGKYIKV